MIKDTTEDITRLDPESATARERLVTSQEFLTTSTVGRKAMLKLFNDSTPEARIADTTGLTRAGVGSQIKEAAKGLGTFLLNELPGAAERAKQTGKDTAAGIVGMGGSVAGAVTGAYLGKKVGLPGTGGTVGELMGSYLGNQGSKFLGLQEGEAFGEPDLSDALSVGVPGAMKLGQAGSRFLARPAVKATNVQSANIDLENAKRNTTYNTDLVNTGAKNVQEADRVQQLNAVKRSEHEQRIANQQFQNDLEKQGIKEQTAANHREWQRTWERIDREFQEDKANIFKQTDISNEAKVAQFKTRQKEWETDKAAHHKAFQTLPQRGVEGFDIGDYSAKYDTARALAKEAGSVEVTNFHNVTKELNIQLSQPAEGVQYPFRRITAALEEFGMAKPGEETAEAALGSMPLERVIATQKRIGQLMGKMSNRSGEEYGAAKSIFKNLSKDLDAAKSSNPTAKVAIETQREAARDFMRSESLADWNDLWYRASKLIEGNTYAIRKQVLRDGMRDLEEKDFFWKLAFTEGERAQMRQAIVEAPNRKVGLEPIMKPSKVATSANREQRYNRDMEHQLDKLPSDQPDYSSLQSKWEPPPTPEKPKYTTNPSIPSPYTARGEPGTIKWPQEPDTGRLPISQFILSKVGVSEMLPRTMGLQGSMPAAGLASGASLFLLPHWTSKALLNNKGLTNKILGHFGIHGKDIVDNIIAGKTRIAPEHRAALTALAKALGATPDESEIEEK